MRQVLDGAITGIENLRLLLEETETLTHCAGLSLDALPWTSSGGGGGSSQGYNQPPNPNAPNASNTQDAQDADEEFDVDDFDSIAYLDPGDLTGPDGSNGPDSIGQREIGKYDPEDRALALGRLHTLAIAASKASKRSLRYCQRLQNYLQRVTTRLDRGEFDKPRGAVESAAGFSQPWLKSDDDPEATR